MKENIKYWIWLSSLPGLGARKFAELKARFGSPEEVWKVVHSYAPELCGIHPELYEALISDRHKQKVDIYMNKAKRLNIGVITVEEEGYPDNLSKIFDPPQVLYTRGNIIKEDKNAVAIVGSRRASHYGLKMAESLAYELACRGIAIVSGMARGIDAAAHRGALKAGGRTIAVLGCGVDIVYPREHRELMMQIISTGAVVSEFAPEAPPLQLNFPARNRIISGLSLGVIVVEAAEKSGSLITADFALEQGREVFAVPGNINNHNSIGTNKLIKQGACLVTCVEDVIEEIGLQYLIPGEGKCSENIHSGFNFSKEADISDEERKVLKLITFEPLHIDRISKISGLSIGSINFVLTMLELKGLVRQLPGRMFVTA